jgi:acyl-coenzyme A thioesterase PaaI-like protein
MNTEKCLQETYAPHNACFGCGPANKKGLRIRSFVQGDKVVAEWTPQAHHEAFPGVLNGGIIGSLLDCHCNWTAAWHLMDSQGLDKPPCTVTMEYTIKLRRPTPTDGPLNLEARVIESDDKVVTVEGLLYAGDKLCDHCIGKFVAVEPGHPAFHRW